MKNLSQELNTIRALLNEKEIKTVSFDIDGTIYPMKAAVLSWFKFFCISPGRSLKFVAIRKKWERKRMGENRDLIENSDVEFFQDFLLSLYHKQMISEELKSFINEILQKDIGVYFLSDHAAALKLKGLGLSGTGTPIDCLTETNELKPHSEISRLLKEKYKIIPETHLHLGDRWTDEEQARLFGCHFRYFIS